MKQLTLNLTVLVLLVTGLMTLLNACKHKQVIQDPIIVVQPSPSATPVPSAMPVVVKNGVFCKEADFSPACPLNPNLDVNRACVLGEPEQCSSGVRYLCKESCN